MTAQQKTWIGIQATRLHAKGWLFRGESLVTQATAATMQAVLEEFDQADDVPVLFCAVDAAPTQTVPAPPLPPPTSFDGGASRLSGLEQRAPAGRMSAADRMMIAGYLALNPGWDGVVCLPGSDMTHWAQISAEEVVSFQSFLTGRLVSCLDSDATAHPDAVAESLSRPERLAAHLRSGEISGQSGSVAGHLIGAELAAARAYWLGQQIALIGDGDLADSYAAALASQAVPVTRAAEKAMMLQGWLALWRARGKT